MGREGRLALASIRRPKVSRLSITVASFAALFVAAPALAADWGSDLRPAYPKEWEMTEDNPLRFEAGARYWLSWGGQNATFDGQELSVRDQTHILELHTKIEDLSTNSYVRAHGGLGVLTTGEYDYTGGMTTDIGGNSSILHAGGDFGWMMFGDMRKGIAFGPLVGYQYNKESPDLGRGNFAVLDSSDDVTWLDGTTEYTFGGDSEINNLDVHALRMGITAKANLSEMFDITAEAAAIPYAHVTGTMAHGNFELDSGAGYTTYKSSATDLVGRAYGAAGEVMVGFHPTENIAVRVGGRASYLAGHLDATYSQSTVFDPYDSDGDGTIDAAPTVAKQGIIQASDFASLFRYGALFEVTGRF
jgi:hypothetical protein